MTWPTGTITTADMDAGTDSPAAARAALLDTAQRVDQIVAHGVPMTLSGAETASGLKTFSNGIAVAGVAPTSAVPASATNDLTRKGEVDAGLAAAIAAVALGGFRGLTLTTTGASANVSVNADALMVLNGSGGAAIVAPAITINTAGSGVNGLDTGTLATNTWYSVWVIYNGTTTAGLISLSGSAPTLPSGYAYKARVGWIRTDGSGNKYPVRISQSGRRVQYVVSPGTNTIVQPTLASGAQGNVNTGAWSAVSVSAFVPPTASRIFGMAANGSLGSGTTMVHPNANAGAYSSTLNPPMVSVSVSTAARTVLPFDLALESVNIYYAADQSDSRLYCSGWEDNL